MMKNKMLIASMLLVLTACSDPKKEEKTLESQVMDMHEKVMADGEKAMQNKMQLDTLMMKKDSLKKADPSLDTAIVMQNGRDLSRQITKADDNMSDWMHNYNPDFSGKPHQEVMHYLEGQKNKVGQINAQYNSVIKASNEYLSKFHKK